MRQAPAAAIEATTGIAISIAGMSKRIGEKEILRDINLEIDPGEFVTLLGPSGSGKTTLLMAIAGLAPFDVGSLRFGDRDVTNLEPYRRDIGIVFQAYALFPHLSVAENIAYPLRMRRVGKAERTERVREVLALVRLQGFGDRMIGSLSGGQRQRVALARAVVFRPKILLMDEPLSALDKPLRDAMQLELRNLHRRLAMTTVYVTHDQREALSLSDRVAVMNNGSIIQIGRPMDLYASPETSFVAEFLGESSLLPVSFQGDQPTFNGQQLALARLPRDNLRQSLLIRPECLFQVHATTPDPGNQFDGTVTDVVLQGESCLVQLCLPSGHLISMRQVATRAFLNALPKIGDKMSVGLSQSDSILVSA